MGIVLRDTYRRMSDALPSLSLLHPAATAYLAYSLVDD